MPPLDKLGGTLSSAQAAHLLRRATFGPSPQQLEDFSNITVDAAMAMLFNPSVPDPELPIDPQTGATWLNPAAGAGNSAQENLMQYFIGWHLEQMRSSGSSIKERIVWFLHSHLPVARSKVTRSESVYYQNALYRYYAFGSFKELFRKLCVDNAMLIYLDNNTNDVSSPNENFAREMFELYSIGRGSQISEGNYTNYTEEDIREAAKVLTGWEPDETYTTLDADTGIPTGRLIEGSASGTPIANRHNSEAKQFSAAFQNQTIEPAEILEGYATLEAASAELDDMIDMIFNQDETARFLVRKMYRHFVYYDITADIETNIIAPLAAEFRDNDYSLSHVLQVLLSSQHFYDTDNADLTDDNKGAIIKSPVDLALGICNLFGIEFPTDAPTLYQTVYQNGLIPIFYEQSLDLYEPYDVAGYDAYFQHPIYNRYWITPYSLAYRYQLSDLLMSGVNANGEELGIQLDILTWVQNPVNISDPSNAGTLVDELCVLMFPFELHDDRKAFFRDDIFLDGIYASAWTDEWNAYLADPSSNESTVRSRLEILIRGLMQSPEYQLY